MRDTFEQIITDFIRSIARRPIGGAYVAGTPEADLQDLILEARTTMDRLNPHWRI